MKEVLDWKPNREIPLGKLKQMWINNIKNNTFSIIKNNNCQKKKNMIRIDGTDLCYGN